VIVKGKCWICGDSVLINDEKVGEKEDKPVLMLDPWVIAGADRQPTPSSSFTWVWSGLKIVKCWQYRPGDQDGLTGCQGHPVHGCWTKLQSGMSVEELRELNQKEQS